MHDTESPALPLKAQQIVAAASTLFLEHGYGSVSMDAIAQKAQVSKPTLYSHFQDKAALFSEVMMAFCKANSGLVVLKFFEEEGSVEEVLTKVARAQLSILLTVEACALMRIVFAETERFPEIGQAFWGTGPTNFLEALQRYLSALHDEGVLHIEDLSDAAVFFSSLLIWRQLFPLLVGVTKPPSAEEIKIHADYAVSEFLRRYKAD